MNSSLVLATTMDHITFMKKEPQVTTREAVAWFCHTFARPAPPSAADDVSQPAFS